MVATTGFCITSSSLSDDTLSESDPVAKKRDIATGYRPGYTPGLLTSNTIQTQQNASSYIAARLHIINEMGNLC